MNFFRSLGGALIVALFGTIVIGGGGGAHALGIEPGVSSAAEIVQLGHTFQWVFAAADFGLAMALFWVVLMEQRPLRDRRQDDEVPHAIIME